MMGQELEQRHTLRPSAMVEGGVGCFLTQSPELKDLPITNKEKKIKIQYL